MIKPMQARNYVGKSPKGWLMSEKLDGARAIWDGSQFWSKAGNPLDVPESITRNMPKGRKVDGELYAGRGNFGRVISALKGGDWTGVEFVAFDLIEDGTAAERHAALKSISGMKSVDRITCEGKRHLRAFEAEIKAQGGEGVMLVKASSKYQHERTFDVQKFKTCDIAEARVTGWNGKSLDVVFNGRAFRIGIGAKEAHAKLPAVAFSFYGMTDNGIPRHAVIMT